jgi:hypothetical protein
MSIKDWALEKGALLWLNPKLERIGSMTKLSIDSARKTVTVELDLKGEATPIVVTIESYRLVVEQGATFLEIGSISTSREWLTSLCADYLKGRRFNLTERGVPSMVIGML